MVFCIVLCLMVGNGDMAAVSIFACLLGTSIAPEPGEAGERMQVPWLVFPLVCITNFIYIFTCIHLRLWRMGLNAFWRLWAGSLAPWGPALGSSNATGRRVHLSPALGSSIATGRRVHLCPALGSSIATGRRVRLSPALGSSIATGQRVRLSPALGSSIATGRRGRLSPALGSSIATGSGEAGRRVYGCHYRASHFAIINLFICLVFLYCVIDFLYAFTSL